MAATLYTLRIQLQSAIRERERLVKVIADMEAKIPPLQTVVNAKGQVIMYDRPSFLVQACGSTGYPSDLKTILATCKNCSAMNDYFCKDYYVLDGYKQKLIQSKNDYIRNEPKIDKISEDIRLIELGATTGGGGSGLFGINQNIIIIAIAVVAIIFIILKFKK